ncbi:MAG: S8 family peptidase [Saprospiraceae bacterium]|nr:S8 family peptidase [Saprospiraceae bacterium]
MNWRIVLFIFFTPLPLFAQQEEYLVPGHNLFVNKIAAQQIRYPQWNGAGIRLSIKEFRFDSSDVDISGRIIANPNAATNVTSHANIMASLAGGAGNADWAGLGAAPGCWLISSSFVGLEPDPDYDQTGISVQNHSYGIDIHNKYDERAAAYDQSVVDHPYLLHVFSSGNKGDSAAVDGPYAGIEGYGNLSGAFKMAKNVLLVGSVDSFSVPALKSSRGPAYDGRIKPDLMAFGKGGSSESAALTSGVAAVVQQVLLENSDTLPYSDLVRAILINSADDIGSPGPDFETGFGQLNALSAVEHAIKQHYACGTLASAQVHNIPLVVAGNVQRCKVTLAWNDPAAAANSPKSLLNDLDLQLISPDGQIFQPWVLHTGADLDTLTLPATTGLDTHNNVEQVEIMLPETGLWEIQIRAASNQTGMQHYSLAWSMDTLHTFQWHYPLPGTPAYSGAPVVLQWQTNITTQTGFLQWRDVRSNQWQTIDNQAVLASGWRRWIIPDTSLAMQLRIVADGIEYPSDTFLVSPELKLQIGFQCPDSVMLYWNKAGSESEYRLYGLGNQSMEPLAMVSDTFIVFSRLQFPQYRFAVAATGFGSQTGARSSAPDITQQGVDCYVKSLLAEWYQGTTEIQIQLYLGTTYGLSSLILEKWIDGRYVSLSAFDANTNWFQFTDPDPLAGENRYRFRIIRQDGSVLESDAALVYYPGSMGYRLFPNPIRSGDMLHLVSVTDGTFTVDILNQQGILLHQQVLEEANTNINWPLLPAGVYFVRVISEEKIVARLKLVAAP